MSLVLALAVGGLAWLGYHSINIWSNGLAGARLAEFAAVAEQIRQDVKRKLDEFIIREQDRPFTDYQYYYVAENALADQKNLPVMKSPLSASIENTLAFGNFQIEPDGSIVTPYQFADDNRLNTEVQKHIENIKDNLLPGLAAKPESRRPIGNEREFGVMAGRAGETQQVFSQAEPLEEQAEKRGVKSRRRELKIESLEQTQRQVQVIEQPKEVYAKNVSYRQSRSKSSVGLPEESAVQVYEHGAAHAKLDLSDIETDKLSYTGIGEVQVSEVTEDTVQIRVEPFTPIVVPGGKKDSVFSGQVFLLRHVQVGEQHFQQGFKLDEGRLLEDIRESANRFMRTNMDYNLGGRERTDVAYSAILDFGFGSVVLNMLELDPDYITGQISRLKSWYFAIVSVVILTMLLVIVSLWRSMRQQVKLVEQKDNFISSVSHELRTPLTSIRMYAEMLEKDWVKSRDKVRQYYTNMRQESERLSRLIENVLDFSRIQKGRKKYSLALGDLNKTVGDVVELMRSYASAAGFTIDFKPGSIKSTVFDTDAITQIVVNLLDNAVKYAKDAEDKTITVRTGYKSPYVVIEIEDHGPGVPHKHRDKVFDVFYRCEAESTRQTKGTGLGLALVSKFAQAHNGFVEIVNAKPHGAVFRICLAAQL